MKLKLKKTKSLEWLLEPLESHPTYLRKKMFGCEAVYIESRLVVVLADSEEPWNGLLVPTDRAHHGALQKVWPNLNPHSVLGKWLYLSQRDPDFESTAMAIILGLARGEQRIGVESKPKAKKKPRAKRR